MLPWIIFTQSVAWTVRYKQTAQWPLIIPAFASTAERFELVWPLNLWVFQQARAQFCGHWKADVRSVSVWESASFNLTHRHVHNHHICDISSKCSLHCLFYFNYLFQLWFWWTNRMYILCTEVHDLISHWSFVVFRQLLIFLSNSTDTESKFNASTFVPAHVWTLMCGKVFVLCLSLWADVMAAEIKPPLWSLIDLFFFYLTQCDSVQVKSASQAPLMSSSTLSLLPKP